MLTTDLQNRKRALAKLMAQENIVVQVVNGLRTADFNIKTRVLRIPNWTSLTLDQWDLLVGHEVGHALYTGHEYVTELQKHRSPKNLHSYFNVIEDTRIEARMRRAYPGMKDTFYRGYRAFTEEGPLFKVVDRKTILVGTEPRVIREMAFIDRINLHYKIGAFVDVPFSPFERKYLIRINNCRTMAEAMAIAKDLYEMAKQPPEEQFLSQLPSGDQSQESEESDASEGSPGADSSDESDDESDEETDDESKKSGSEDSDEESDDESDDGAGTGDDETDDSDAADEESDESGSGDDETEGSDESEMPAPQDPSEDPFSETDEDAKAALNDVAQSAPAVMDSVMCSPLPTEEVTARTVSVETWLTGAERAAKITSFTLDTWNDRYLATAKFMAQDFHRRKTAASHLKARIGRTGKLNMARLHSYQFADDLFKRSMIVPNGQSHGIVMIIDGSGSMDSVFADVLNQALLFGTFAFYARIPFECYLFTDVGTKFIRVPVPDGTLRPSLSGRLVTVLNTSVHRREFQRQSRVLAHVQRLYDEERPDAIRNIPFATLGGTPLYTGMMLMDAHMGRMKRTLNLDKVMSVVISDGGDTAGLEYDTVRATAVGIQATSERWGNIPAVVTDTVTNRQYSTTKEDGSVRTNCTMELLFNIQRDRYNARGIYIYLSNDAGMGRVMARTDAVMDYAAMASQMNRDSQCVLPAGAGVTDCCIVMSPQATRMADVKFGDTDLTNESPAYVANEYTNSMVRAKRNKVFSNAVMPFLI